LSELLFRDDAYLASCEARVVAVRDGAVELDRTVFYPTGGGQPGDTGRIGEWRVIDTRKGDSPDSVLHVLEPGFALEPGNLVKAEVDWQRRLRHMRYHTALHLLCAVVKAPVTGGRMAADKAHLDFDIEMEKLVREEIEAGVNALVKAGHDVLPRWVSDAELDARPDP
jgi:misacylated tRNA(Ala) deacylase